MRRFRLFFVFFLLVTLVACQEPFSRNDATQPTTTPEPPKVVIYLFWGDGCPHCAAAKPFLNQLTQRYPQVELRAYEVWYVQKNQDLFQKMTAAYGFEPQGVPTIFIGDQYWEGYSDKIGQEIEAAVQKCEENDCPDHGVGVITD